MLIQWNQQWRSKTQIKKLIQVFGWDINTVHSENALCICININKKGLISKINKIIIQHTWSNKATTQQGPHTVVKLF